MSDSTLALSIALGITSTLLGCISVLWRASASDCDEIDCAWGLCRIRKSVRGAPTPRTRHTDASMIQDIEQDSVVVP